MRSEFDDLSDSKIECNTLAPRLRAVIHRVAHPSTSYFSDAEAAANLSSTERVLAYAGIVEALERDIKAGWLQSIAELLHADTFADMLDQATELLEKSYKDAAAVIAGSALEVHLRQLCVKNNVTLETVSHTPKKADTLNVDLVKAGAYQTIQQKSVTAWLGIRNSAAHGKYAEYSIPEVRVMVDAIRTFIVSYPA